MNEDIKRLERKIDNLTHLVKEGNDLSRRRLEVASQKHELDVKRMEIAERKMANDEAREERRRNAPRRTRRRAPAKKGD